MNVFHPDFSSHTPRYLTTQQIWMYESIGSFFIHLLSKGQHFFLYQSIIYLSIYLSTCIRLDRFRNTGFLCVLSVEKVKRFSHKKQRSINMDDWTKDVQGNIYLSKIRFLSVCIYPSPWVWYDTRSVFMRSKPGLNSSFFFLERLLNQG